MEQKEPLLEKKIKKKGNDHGKQKKP